MVAETAISEAAIAEGSSDEEFVFPEITVHLDFRPMMIIGQGIYRADTGLTFAGDPIVVNLERVGWTIEGVDRNGEIKHNPATVKLLREVWPVLRGEIGTTVNFYFGAQLKDPESDVVWQGPFPFVIGQDTSVQPLVEGAYLACRVESNNQESWSLLSLDLDLQITGEVF